ncbi:transcriptional regulator, AraC family [Celeribacter baekdonensis]|uniref:Transcriptional regulator, AraC family n=1 Tax=Celeribacter baekdonensis TaxID=875171 RepID=A0A1G7M6C4_9RHOB|nr:AraC family transcriptional regulator [Celeribacter baekdonensis]SDF57225.1 transcriptional regulator, AraC family [Celeribacter baekdonensis]
MAQDYDHRLLRVLTYIEANLEGDLSLDQLAEVAALSRFHFHRVFRAMTGETVAQAVRRVRLRAAAAELLRGGEPIEAIAARHGYPNLSSFSRAFRDQNAMSPGAFRERGFVTPQPLSETLPRQKEFTMYDIDIRDMPAHRLAAIAHLGDYMKVNQAFGKAGAVLGARGMMQQAGPMIGVYLDDPSSVPLDALRSYAGMSVPEGALIEEPLEEIALVGGKYAVLRYVGPYEGLPKAYATLFGSWLPQSGEVPRDAPPYELYENTPMDTAPEDLVTLICVPLQ